MPTTKFFSHRSSNFIAETQRLLRRFREDLTQSVDRNTRTPVYLWDKETEINLITKIYESIDDVALWFPESLDTEEETITIYQIISWIEEAIMILARGKSVRVRPYGSSLRGTIESGQLVELVPSDFDNIQTGDVVLVKWEQHYLLNKVIEVGKDTLLTGNNRGKIQGWVGKKALIARVDRVFVDG